MWSKLSKLVTTMVLGMFVVMSVIMSVHAGGDVDGGRIQRRAARLRNAAKAFRPQVAKAEMAQKLYAFFLNQIS